MHLRGIKQMLYYALKLFFPLQWGLSRNSSWTPGPRAVGEAADAGSATFRAALWKVLERAERNFCNELPRTLKASGVLFASVEELLSEDHRWRSHLTLGCSESGDSWRHEKRDGKWWWWFPEIQIKSLRKDHSLLHLQHPDLYPAQYNTQCLESVPEADLQPSLKVQPPTSAESCSGSLCSANGSDVTANTTHLTTMFHTSISFFIHDFQCFKRNISS